MTLRGERRQRDPRADRDPRSHREAEAGYPRLVPRRQAEEKPSVALRPRNPSPRPSDPRDPRLRREQAPQAAPQTTRAPAAPAARPKAGRRQARRGGGPAPAAAAVAASAPPAAARRKVAVPKKAAVQEAGDDVDEESEQAAAASDTEATPAGGYGYGYGYGYGASKALGSVDSSSSSDEEGSDIRSSGEGGESEDSSAPPSVEALEDSDEGTQHEVEEGEIPGIVSLVDAVLPSQASTAVSAVALTSALRLRGDRPRVQRKVSFREQVTVVTDATSERLYAPLARLGGQSRLRRRRLRQREVERSPPPVRLDGAGGGRRALPQVPPAAPASPALEVEMASVSSPEEEARLVLIRRRRRKESAGAKATAATTAAGGLGDGTGDEEADGYDDGDGGTEVAAPRLAAPGASIFELVDAEVGEDLALPPLEEVDEARRLGIGSTCIGSSSATKTEKKQSKKKQEG